MRRRPLWPNWPPTCARGRRRWTTSPGGQRRAHPELGLGEIIRRIKALTGTPVAVLTNGALLYLPEVRDELAAADLVLPSLDAAREESFGPSTGRRSIIP